MTWKKCRRLIVQDLHRVSHKQYSVGRLLRFLFTNPGFKLVFWFRIGTFLQEKRNLPFRIMYLLAFVIHRHYVLQTGIQLPIGTRVGGGILFPHFSCIVINSSSIIGKNVSIFQGVTIGSKRGGGVPKIGDNVVLFAGSKVIGGVTLADNVKVGANSVVTKDAPAGSVVAGIPAKVISEKGKELSMLYLA